MVLASGISAPAPAVPSIMEYFGYGETFEKARDSVCFTVPNANMRPLTVVFSGNEGDFVFDGVFDYNSPVFCVNGYSRDQIISATLMLRDEDLIDVASVTLKNPDELNAFFVERKVYFDASNSNFFGVNARVTCDYPLVPGKAPTVTMHKIDGRSKVEAIPVCEDLEDNVAMIVDLQSAPFLPFYPISVAAQYAPGTTRFYVGTIEKDQDTMERV